MSSGNLLRDALEFLVLLAVGGTLFSAIVRLKRGQIKANHCNGCGKGISRAYVDCPRCGASQVSNA